MQSIDYTVSLQVRHPEIEPDELTRWLGLAPENSGAEGEAKAERPGIRAENYWVHRFEQPDGVGLRDFLCILTGKLWEHRWVFEKVASSQGRVQLFVEWGAEKGGAEALDWKLLQKLAELRIDLVLEG